MGISDKRPVAVKTPLDEDVLLFRSMQATETLGQLPRYELELLSKDEAIDLTELLGEVVTVRLDTTDAKRYFNGHVTRFEYAGRREHRYVYRLTMHPWLWFLKKHGDCRIFPNMSVIDILKSVCGDHGFSAINDGGLSSKPETREYTVQYNESDYDFVTRLLEDEGIYWWFAHEDGEHELVLGDGPSSHEAVDGYASIPFRPQAEAESIDRDHIVRWAVSNSVVSKGFGLEDWNFETPTVDLKVAKEKSQAGVPDRSEMFGYPGVYSETGAGELIADRRLQEAQADFEVVDGSGTARGLTIGAQFELSGCTRSDQNRAYMVRSVTHRIKLDDHDAEEFTSVPKDFYENDFQAIEAKHQHRPPRITPKPIVRGPQTALVVGSGDIDVDEYGRVLVKFHWDREGQDSRRVRVSHNWAGANWGGIFMPWVGHEVIVDFFEGDPDQPVVTGRVYNAENMPPNALPDDKTKAIIRDSAKNEFIMESKGGSEMIELRDKYGNEIVMDAVAGTMLLRSPTHESKIRLGESVKIDTLSDFFAVVTGNHDTKVTGNQSANVAGDSQETIIGKKDIKVGADVKTVFMGAKHETTIGSTSGFLGGFKTETIVGVVTDIKKAKVTEIAYGSKLTHNRAKNLNKTPDQIDAIDKLEQKVDKAKSAIKDFTLKCGTKYHMTTEDLKEKASKKLEDLGKWTVKVKGNAVQKAADIKIDAKAAWKVKAPQWKAEAQMLAIKASMINIG